MNYGPGPYFTLKINCRLLKRQQLDFSTTHPEHPCLAPQGGKGLRFHAMPIGTTESKKQVDYKLVYGRADGMPDSLGSMAVCG
jgi:hypothetical protein